MERKKDAKFTFKGLAYNTERICYTYNVYLYIKNNALLRLVQSLLSIYIGEGFFLFTSLFNTGYSIKDIINTSNDDNVCRMGYQIIFIPLGICIVFSLFFVLVSTWFFLKWLNNRAQGKNRFSLDLFHKTTAVFVVITHTLMGMVLLFLFYKISDVKIDWIWSICVVAYSFFAGFFWGLTDCFSDMQILESRFIANPKTNCDIEYSKRASCFIIYCKFFFASIIIIVALFTITLTKFDSILLDTIFGKSEAGIYVFITTQISLMIIYFKLAFSRIRNKLNMYFDFCDLKI